MTSYIKQTNWKIEIDVTGHESTTFIQLCFPEQEEFIQLKLRINETAEFADNLRDEIANGESEPLEFGANRGLEVLQLYSSRSCGLRIMADYRRIGRLCVDLTPKKAEQLADELESAVDLARQKLDALLLKDVGFIDQNAKPGAPPFTE